MEEQKFRNKIIWFTFLFSVLVIWVHSYNAVLFLGTNKIAYQTDYLERFLGNTVAQVAVPGFFLISSYLFFRTFALNRIWVKWNSRIRSVLVPYILWNFLYYLGYVIGSRIPVLTNIIGMGKIPFTITQAGEAILSHTYNYVFWYLNQLIILLILSPIIFLMVKKKIIGGVFLLGILISIYLGGDLKFVNLDAMLYYTVGAFAAVHGKEIVERTWDVKALLVGGTLIVLACLVYGFDFPGEAVGEVAASIVLFRLFVPVALWLMVPEFLLFEAKEWMKQNFFLYAIHFAMVRLINKTGAFLLPSVPVIPIGIFLMMPVVCVFFSYYIACLLRKFLPRTWCLLNGGR